MVHLAQTCTFVAPTLTLSPIGPKQESSWPTSPMSSIGESKTISKPMVCLAQTVHLSCVKINTISKWTKTSFHLSLVSLQSHRVHAKRFLSLWYVCRKSCTYLAPTLIPSSNRLKWDLTWPTSPRSSIGFVQNNFQAYCSFGAHSAPILRQEWHYLQPDRNEHPLEPRHLGVPSGASKMIPKPMVHLAQTMHLSCTDTNTVSKWTKIGFDMTYVT
jgi:hypothetical protein